MQEITKFFWDHMYIAPNLLPEHLCSIEETLVRQEEFFAQKAMEENSEKCNFLVFAEHEPVYTCKPEEKDRIESGDREGLLKPGVEKLPAPLFAPEENRGGSITYHGPGQLVCYMIVCLEELGIKHPVAINNVIENSIRELLAGFGIKTNDPPKLSGAQGVWATTQEGISKKIASRGLKCKSAKSKDPDAPPRHITKYGFALNISSDLSYFDYIYPCGLDIAMTSVKDLKGRIIHKTLGENPPMYRISEFLAKILIKNFRNINSKKAS